MGTQLIRGVSGGERKRTNIGMELIIDPSVLFLDEPTTGLDASTANSVLLLLKRCVSLAHSLAHTNTHNSSRMSFVLRMANHGRTIILSIHQPRYSIYKLFDSLTLLVNGKQVQTSFRLSLSASFVDILKILYLSVPRLSSIKQLFSNLVLFMCSYINNYAGVSWSGAGRFGVFLRHW